jgi:hypothetical protein
VYHLAQTTNVYRAQAKVLAAIVWDLEHVQLPLACSAVSSSDTFFFIFKTSTPRAGYIAHFITSR